MAAYAGVPRTKTKPGTCPKLWPMNWKIVLFAICLPLRHLEITSPFGYRIHPVTKIYSFHNGVDLRAQSDTVYAVSDGIVKAAGYDDKFGLFIHLNHWSFQSSYGHLKQVFVNVGDTAFAGQPIGITGRPRLGTGEQLHFSICCGKRSVDPLEFLYQQLILQHHE